jgi:hypothetical protein
VAHPQEIARNAPAAAFAQNHCSAPSDDRTIRQIAEQWRNGYDTGNAAKVASFYAADAYYLTQHFATGIVHGRAAIRAYVRRGTDASYHVDSIEILKTGCSADLAYAIGRYESTNAVSVR